MDIWVVLVLLMICNRNGITSVGRWEFVKAFVEDFVAILVAIHFATPFATKNDRENFVEISSKISLLQLKFDEIWTNCLTKFWRFFFWQNVVAKRFATNQHFVKMFVFFDFWGVAKCFVTTFLHQKNRGISWKFRWESAQTHEIPTKSWRNKIAKIQLYKDSIANGQISG